MINCTINGKKRSFDIDPLTRLRDMLVMNGNFAVRDSDDAEGFCGSDTVLLDGAPVFSTTSRIRDSASGAKQTWTSRASIRQMASSQCGPRSGSLIIWASSITAVS